MVVDELEDIEACVREGRRPREKGPYGVKIAFECEDFERKKIEDPAPTGRQIIAASGVTPVDEHLVFMVLRGGVLEELRLDEIVDLREPGAEKFIVFKSAQSHRFSVDGERREWGAKAITGFKIKLLSGATPADVELWQVNREGEDVLIADEDIVDLSSPGLERFYTGEKEPRSVTIIVNGREKTIETRKLSFDDLIKLAFENPPTGEFICFTITYRKGHPDKPEGSLIEGACVIVKKGMVFNVTYTDKS